MYLTGVSSPVNLMIGCTVIIWAIRLGAFLFRRVRSAGHDRRFRTIKPNFLQFLMAWTIQGLWVFMAFAAGLAAMTSGTPQPLDIFSGIGIALWFTGLTIEILADNQKLAFKRQHQKTGMFIRTGLWAGSRHPNYFGEVLLWIGIAMTAIPSLSGWQYLTLISPIFVFVLLNYVSGVRILEERAERKWGDDINYQQYCRKTPKIVINPWLIYK